MRIFFFLVVNFILFILHSQYPGQVQTYRLKYYFEVKLLHSYSYNSCSKVKVIFCNITCIIQNATLLLRLLALLKWTHKTYYGTEFSFRFGSTSTRVRPNFPSLWCWVLKFLVNTIFTFINFNRHIVRSKLNYYLGIFSSTKTKLKEWTILLQFFNC